MSIVSRIKAGLTAIGINFDKFLADAIESLPTPAAPIHVLPEPKLVSIRGRDRSPNKHRAFRRAAGIPHGTSGAKLARRAAAGRIGI